LLAEREDRPSFELDRVDVRRELEVVVQRARRAVAVVRLARSEQVAVQLLVPVLHRALREQNRPVALARVPRRPDQPQQPRRPRRLVEREVECAVRAHRLPDVAAAPRLVVGVQVRARRLGVARLEQLSGAPHRHALEREPDREELPELLDVEPHHLRPVVRHVLGEAQGLELPDGFADRRDAHPERAGEILEAQGRPGLQLAHDDRLAEALQRSLGHRPVTRRRRETRVHGRGP
jgi:hypothetical protein